MWILTGSLGLALSACDPGKKPAPPGAASGPQPPLRKVQTVPVTRRQLERSIVALGSLLAHAQATLSAKVPGRVQSVEVDLGSHVRPGDLLVQIEPRDYELRVRQAVAGLAQARALLGLPLEGERDQIDPAQVSTVKEARAVLDEAKANRERVTQLSQEKILSQSQVDTAQAAYLVALNRYQDTQEKVRQQHAMVVQRRVEYEIAKQQLADTTLVAPFDGGIQERQADVGEYLTVGAPIVTLVRLDPLRLRVEVSERDAHQVHLNQAVRLTLEGDPQIYRGTVQRLSPALNETTRMLIVEADIRNEGRLHPGSFARAEIVTAPESAVLTIPTNAVVTFAGLEKAFMVRDQKAAERRIVTGQTNENWVEVISGLAVGEAVILNPGNLQTGNPVDATAATE